MRMKRRIAVGAAAVAAAVTLGSCGNGTQTGQNSTQIESTSEGDSRNMPEGASEDTSKGASLSITGKTEENAVTDNTTQIAEDDNRENAAVGITEISSESITEIDVFVEEHNYNPVVYGPPEE